MIRDYKYRIEVLRNGATLTTLEAIGTPSVDCVAKSPIKTSMTGIFRENPLVNWLTDEIKPVQIIDGVETPVGVFPAATVTRGTDEAGRRTVKVDAYDRGMLLNQAKLEEPYFASKGTKYLTAVVRLLAKAGIALYLATDTPAVLQTDREDWDIGTSCLEIINQLLSEINYNPIWFNSSGMAIIQPERVPTAENINHTYSTTDGLRVLHRPTTVETDAFDAPNVFIVICSNPELPEPMIARAENNNPLSSLSIFKRGRRITQVVQVDNIPSQDDLQAYANKLATESMLATETVTISTANMPGHQVLDTIAVNHPDLDGIYQEVGWHLLLEPGAEMIHEIRKSVII